jgi:hypothetical protein
MSELQETTPAEVVPYRRGVSLKATLRGAFKRFLPAAGVLYGGAAVLGMFIEPSAWLIPGLALVAGGLTAGFGLGLEVLRRWLYPDAKVDGRRSMVAGLLSPFALMAAAAFAFPGGMGPVKLTLVVVLTGVLMALAMFFPWLTPTPPDQLEREFEQQEDGVLLRRGAT